LNIWYSNYGYFIVRKFALYYTYRHSNANNLYRSRRRRKKRNLSQFRSQNLIQSMIVVGAVSVPRRIRRKARRRTRSLPKNLLLSQNLRL